ncbi:SAM-dependent methyltransferase, MidA family [Aneurinibacillus thermoaerophilus]|uniref:SAM-dependent methyltransferase n=1 Tax=Aneurinibacillus thermoaerophilus TaxID=143495 RepID=A0A1G7W7N6_ANETH|nr:MULTISPECIES: SAM-dependent methyltransferase [Aneurinibacillus]AMA72554.1 hypothetical protein ACH33_06610 [Aneurinibacillus sp. XH2]MED0674745.1 SAM-dependent methyltransferase [Aneurinibacillus thermoaerophilus]QYY41697.1 SAM-dependent methyltransferase [Aneurinibacillus thermoaerophilus]SDG67809.1 SAM-dependent methyltransferase, MidA family [Aneurinibacillus thermoaerophilus]
MNVISVIKDKIRNAPEKMIPFRTYMEYALYHPQSGYYQRYNQKIGKKGDFYTNVSVGSVYGEVMADVIWEMIVKLPDDRPRAIVEIGGGTGQLSAQILHYFKEKCLLPLQNITYIMIESSNYHRRLQKETLETFRDMVEIRWYESMAQAKKEIPELRGVLFSNELADAFPVHLIEYRDGEWQEVYVTENKNSTQKFSEKLGPLSVPELGVYIKRENIPSLEGYRTEVNLAALQWMIEMAEWLTQGYVLTVDYGYERKILYAPSRNAGTLLCYRAHTVSENPYKYPGECDMTSHVNFSALMDAGMLHGLETIGFYSQQQFLIQAGILTRLQGHAGGDPFASKAAKRNRAIRQLIMPEGMGQAFCVLIQAKKTDHKLACCRPWDF